MLQGRPCTLWIVRSTPREARLLRKIAQGLSVRLDLFKLIRIKRIVRYDKMICESKPFVALGAYASREFFGCRYGRDIGLFFGHAFGMGLGVGEHGIPFLCELGGIRVNMIREAVFRDDIGIISGSVDDLFVIHIFPL